MSEHAFRQVALTLHGLHARDRAWIIGQLDVGVRSRIQALVAELRALGIESTPGAAETMPPPAANHSLAAALVDEIDAIDGETAYAVLGDLPRRFQAAVLLARRWRWSAAVWLRLAASDRHLLLKATDAMANVRTPVLASILAVFSTRAKQRRVNSAPSGRA